MSAVWPLAAPVGDGTRNRGDTMSSADRKRVARSVNAPGWKLVDDRWLWWDGSRYTYESDGVRSVAVGEWAMDQAR